MTTLVVQSFRTRDIPPWIDRCLASVRQWASRHGFSYRFVGDSLFALVPDWYLEKAGDRLPVATDYARLVLMRNILAEEAFERVIWLDADVLVFDQTFAPVCAKSCAFGREVWIQREGAGGEGKLKVRKNVHNAVCIFRQGCVVLPFLIQTVESIIRRADPDRIVPQMAGPKLLSALHSLCDFDLLPRAGAISPAVAADLAGGGGKALALLGETLARPLQAVNLCASLIDPEAAGIVIDQLLDTSGDAGLAFRAAFSDAG